MGEGEGKARSVRRTRAVEAFPSVGAKLRFLFDYGDGWEFLVELVKRKPKEPKVKLPRLLISAGKAPAQYPDAEDK
jgi:Plasmid pRiA4b ORF-3-like protein